MSYGHGLLEIRVDKYDGQTVFSNHQPLYELGNYLGQGAAGSVYEAFHSATSQTVALKILNPIGFKLLPSGSLQRYIVAKKGEPRDDVNDDGSPKKNKKLDPNNHRSANLANRQQHRTRRSASGVGGGYSDYHHRHHNQSSSPGGRPAGAHHHPPSSSPSRQRGSSGGGSGGGGRSSRRNFSHPAGTQGTPPLSADQIWWLVHPTTKHVVAAYEDPQYGNLRELPLPRCVEIWGWNPPEADEKHSPSECAAPQMHVPVQGEMVAIPRVPRKFVNFVRARRSVYREISNMAKLGTFFNSYFSIVLPSMSGVIHCDVLTIFFLFFLSGENMGHPNVLGLHEVLELVQDSVTTIFLVLEMANGGELFDRIKVDQGTEEDTARTYMRQLLRYVHP